jgi:hypothetical protein
MSAEGRMAVPSSSVAQLLDHDRFKAASHLLAVTEAR